MNDPDTGPPDTARFRRVMGSFPTGIAVVTAMRGDGEPVGFTANSITSVSLDPLLILVCIDHGSASHEVILESGAFAVNFLTASSESVSDLFAGGDRSDRFDQVSWKSGATGSPLLEGALGWLDCRVHQTHVAGDHTIVVGRVERCDHREGDPLVFHRGGYARLAR